MRVYAVIDTNVLVSALLSKKVDASTVIVLDALFCSKIVPVFNDEIISEYLEVLHRPKFHFSEQLITTVLRSITDNGVRSDRFDTGEKLPDPKDLVFYEVVMAKQKEGAMLVTGNMRHFPAKPFIVTPKEMVEILSR